VTCNTSEVAVCCSSASASSQVRFSSCFFNAISDARLPSRSNESCDRAYGFSRLFETRSPEPPPAEDQPFKA
jgi:hypothetical protein